MPNRVFLRWTGAALAAGGALTFLINACLTPLLPRAVSFAETVASPIFPWRAGMAAAAAALLMFGSVGLYLRQAERAGRFGAVAFAVALLGSALVLATEWLFDQLQLGSRGGNAVPGFLLERVQHVDGAGEPDGVHGPVRVAVEVIHDLQYASAPESLERLSEGRLQTQLRIPKRAADLTPDFLRETPQILPATADPAHRLGQDLFSGRHRLPGPSSP